MQVQNPKIAFATPTRNQSVDRERLWELSSDLLGILNADGYFESTNPAWTTALGWKSESMLATSIFDLIHPDDVEKTRISFKDAEAQADGVLRFENRYRRADGEYRWLSWAAVPEAGKFYCSGRDVTQEREARTELAAALDALRQSQKMEAVGELTGGIAHDFNNLLMAIAGSLELLSNRLTQGRMKEAERYIVTAQSATKRAAALTHRLLAFARRQPLDPRPTDLNRLVAGMEDLIDRTVGPSVKVEVVGAADLWITADRSESARECAAEPVHQCARRDAAGRWLGSRSRRPTASAGRAAAAAERERSRRSQYVSLCVTDTGTGMAPAVIARAFDPFYTTKPLGAGHRASGCRWRTASRGSRAARFVSIHRLATARPCVCICRDISVKPRRSKRRPIWRTWHRRARAKPYW